MNTPTTNPPAATNSHPRASLQGLPPELRNMIYGHLAATEDRIVLGRRFVEVRGDEEDLSLDECFDKAVALHPLSMTCRQMRDEFQDLHFSDPHPRWVLVINNFDIPQITVFNAYLASGEFFARDCDLQKDSTVVWPECIVRFQMDNEAVRSTAKLCDHLRRKCLEEPFADGGEITGEMVHRLRHVEVFTQYHARTTAQAVRHKSMLPEEADCVEYLFGKTARRINESETWGDEAAAYIGWRWMSRFLDAVEEMPREPWPVEPDEEDGKDEEDDGGR